MAKRITDLTELGDGNDLSGYFAEIDKSSLGESMKIDLKTLLRGLFDSSGYLAAKASNGGLSVNYLNILSYAGDKTQYPRVAGHIPVYTTVESLGLDSSTTTVWDIVNKVSSGQMFVGYVNTNSMPNLDLPRSEGLLTVNNIVSAGRKVTFNTSSGWSGIAQEFRGFINPGGSKWYREGAIMAGEFKKVGGNWQCKFQGNEYSVAWDSGSSEFTITHNLDSTGYLCSFCVNESTTPKRTVYYQSSDAVKLKLLDEVSNIDNVTVRFKIEVIGTLITPA